MSIRSGPLSFATQPLNTNKCTVLDSSKCDKSCNVDSDCKISGCSCINKDEIMTNPDNVMLDCLLLDCKCVNNKCEKSDENNETCVKSGGRWILDRLALDKPENYICVYDYSDGGKSCNNSEECLGNCIVTTNISSAKCASTSSPYGCFSTIEDYRKTGRVLCMD